METHKTHAVFINAHDETSLERPAGSKPHRRACSRQTQAVGVFGPRWERPAEKSPSESGRPSGGRCG